MTWFKTDKVRVRAVQWFPQRVVDGVREYSPTLAELEAVEGSQLIKPGDWIVTTAEGQRFAVSDEVFRDIYEAA